jgi:hypothetical protein
VFVQEETVSRRIRTSQLLVAVSQERLTRLEHALTHVLGRDFQTLGSNTITARNDAPKYIGGNHG